MLAFAFALQTLASSPNALAEAYVRWGRSADAAAFASIAGEPGTLPDGGLPPDLLGAVVVSEEGRYAAVEIGDDVLLADAVTGTPRGWVVGATTTGMAFVGSSAVFTQAIANATDGAVEIEGAFVARHADRAHVLDSISLDPGRPDAPSQARLRVWSLRRHRLILERRRLTTPEEDEQGVVVPQAIGSSSAAIVTPHGVWSVHTGRFTRFDPEPTRAVRSDGRYVVTLKSEGRIDDGTFRANLVEILDLARGTTARTRLDTTMLSNGSPFSFKDDDRLVVSDYGRWVIALPSGRVLREGSRDTSASPPSGPPGRTPGELALLARIDRASCHVGALVLPADACFPDRPRPSSDTPPAHPDRGAPRPQSTSAEPVPPDGRASESSYRG